MGKRNDHPSSLQDRFTTISEQLRSHMEGEALADDECIYHYTNAEGLIGIVNDGQIWATNYRFLNDQTEFMYGFDIARSIIQKEYSGNHDELLHELLHQACAGQHWMDLFAACFSENHDELSQWRLYGDGGLGYSVGIQYSDISRLLTDLSANRLNFGFSRVLYDPEQQKSAFKLLIDAVVQLAHEAAEKSPTAVTECKEFLGNQVLRLCASMKHPAFQSEREWRLTCFLSPRSEEKVHFRAGRFGITPYITFPSTRAKNGMNQRFHIKNIYYGAKHDSAMAEYALKRLISSRSTMFSPSSCPIK